MPFDLLKTLPFMLEQAAETIARNFETQYKERFDLIRPEWCVLFFLGSFGDLTATDICKRGNLHKTKASRAVSSLEKRGFVTRHSIPNDRRHEVLNLTHDGEQVFRRISEMAEKFDAELCGATSQEDVAALRRCLATLSHPKQSGE